MLSHSMRNISGRTFSAVTTFTSTSIGKNCRCEVAGSLVKRFLGQSFSPCAGSLKRNESNTIFTTVRGNRSTWLFSPGRRSISTFSERRNKEALRETSEYNQHEALDNLRNLQRRQKRLMEEPEIMEPHVIYKGILATQMRQVKIFSLTTSLFGLAMQPILILRASELAVIANVAVFTMVGFFTYATPVLIHIIAKKYVTEMVYDPVKDLYTATTYTFFLQKKQTTFSMDDLKVPEVPGPFTTITVNSGEQKNIPLFVAPEAFLKPSHYGRFMGYDKPIDLHLNVESTENESKSKS